MSANDVVTVTKIVKSVCPSGCPQLRNLNSLIFFSGEVHHIFCNFCLLLCVSGCPPPYPCKPQVTLYLLYLYLSVCLSVPHVHPDVHIPSPQKTNHSVRRETRRFLPTTLTQLNRSKQISSFEMANYISRSTRERNDLQQWDEEIRRFLSFLGRTGISTNFSILPFFSVLIFFGFGWTRFLWGGVTVENGREW